MSKPNIVFVLCDDLDTETIEHVPELKSLVADQGIEFTEAFVTYPVCCPSRVSYLRGQYTHNHRVLTNQNHNGAHSKTKELTLEDEMLPVWLKRAGYRTAIFGKYMNGFDEQNIPLGWDRFFGVMGLTRHQRFNDQGMLADYPPDTYLFEDVLREQSLSWLRDSAQDESPFFMCLWTHAPHQPATPAARHMELFEDLQLPRQPNYDEEDVADKPSWVRKLPPITDADADKMTKLYRDRARCTVGVYEMLEPVIKELDAQGKLSNTYIIFSADHGFHFGNHRLRQGKQSPYDEDVRVPFYVRGPEVPAGVQRNEMIASHDVAPTICELAGADYPKWVDGSSFVQLLSSDAGKLRWRKAVGLEAWTLPGTVVPDYHAVRTHKFKYVEYRGTGEVECYDLSRDPHEINNVVESVDLDMLNYLKDAARSIRNSSATNTRVTEGFEKSGAGSEKESELFRGLLQIHENQSKHKEESQLDQLRYNLHKKSQESDRLKTRVNKLEQTNVSLKSQLEAMRSSRSWKLLDKLNRLRVELLGR